MYLLSCLLDERVLMGPKGYDEPEETIEMSEVEGIGQTLWLDHQQALKGMYYFLNLLPLVGTFLDLRQVCLDDLIDPFVLLDEDEQQVVGGFSDFGLDGLMCTF